LIANRIYLDGLLARLPFYILFILVFQLSVATIFARFKLWHPVRRNVERVDFGTLSSRVAEFIVSRTSGLIDAGFSSYTHLHSRSMLNQDCYVSILINRTTGDLAEVICVVTPGGGGVFGASYSVSLLTRFEDGSSISTGNSKLPSIFRSNPRNRSINLRRIPDPQLLHRIHRARAVRHANSFGRPWLPEPGGEISDHLDRDLKTMTDQVAAGYYRLDEPAQQFRATWKGAFVITAKLITPVKQIRLRQRDRIADAELREIGFYDEVHRPREAVPV
jgi:hypothetical protein